MDRDQYYLSVAAAAARASTCPRRSVGAVVVVDRVIVSTGYNGAPRGLAHCGCLIVDGHCTRAVHAEVNALMYAARSGSLKGASLYTSSSPCIDCAKLILQAGISELVYRDPYVDNRALMWGFVSVAEMLLRAGVYVRCGQHLYDVHTRSVMVDSKNDWIGSGAAIGDICTVNQIRQHLSG